MSRDAENRERLTELGRALMAQEREGMMACVYLGPFSALVVIGALDTLAGDDVPEPLQRHFVAIADQIMAAFEATTAGPAIRESRDLRPAKD